MKEYSNTNGEALPDIDEADYAPGATALPVAMATGIGTVGILISDEGDAFTHMTPRLLVPSLSNRKAFNQEDLQAMAETVKAWGVRHPLIVRPLPGNRLQETRLSTPKGQPLPTHEIVCGERRWLAAGLAGVPTVPVIVRHLTDEQALEEQVTENVQREAYTVMEEGEAYQRLMTQNHLTADQVAAKVGKSRRHIFNRTKLLDLHNETRQALINGDIDPTKALLLTRIPDHEQQIKALAKVTEKNYQGEPLMSLRDAERYIQREFMLSLETARFDIQDIALVPNVGSCKDCTSRTGHNPDLFSDVKGADLCTNAPCFRRKEEAHQIQVLQQATANGHEVITGREAKALMPNSWGAIEGYLRLDDPEDSPNSKPLRKLLENQLGKEAIQLVLIENPHKQGEMMAALPSAQVALLLKAEGEEAAAKKITEQLGGKKKAEVEAEKKKLKDAYEVGWRNALLKRTWAAVQAAQLRDTGHISEAVLRRICAHYASQANTERAKHLCSLLELGKVAPVEALSDHVKTCTAPENLLLLLVMQRDVGYTPWIPSDYGMNAALLQVAADFGIDVTEVQADIKKEIKAQLRTKPVQATDPSLPVLRTTGGAGETKKSGGTSGAPAPRKQKISADEATSGIAAAMRQMGSGLSDACGISQQDEHTHADSAPQAGATALAVAAAAGPVQGTLAVGVIGIGSRVKVLSNVSIRYTKWIGKTGTVTKKMGDRAWDVTFKGRAGGLASFDANELEVVS